MGNRIVICHWDNGGHWEAIEISTAALGGHQQHETDIWPPVPDVTEGQNWPDGEAVYLNNCALAVTESPSASATTTPSPSDTLPDTGPGENLAMTVLGLALIAAGAWMKVKAMRAGVLIGGPDRG